MSFQQALSGLNATSKNLQVIGNNIANANTFGSKVARAEFGDMYAAALSGAGANQIGIGVNLQAVAQQFTQGNLKTTENPMDLAINGPGFFQLDDGKGQVSYSRNGQFKVDKDGFIVSNSRDRLMGYPADDAGVIQPGQAGALQLPTGGVAPKVTETLKVEANLDSRGKVTGDAAMPPMDYADAKTYNSATSVTVYDTAGEPVALTFYFQKSADNNWNVYTTANGKDATDTTGGTPTLVTTIAFEPNGTSPTPASTSLSIGATTLPTGGMTEPMTIEFSFDKLTQYGAPFGVTDLKQDGYSAGQLAGIVVENDGVVMARYSNGQSRPAGQLALANFRNPQGLQAVGENAWVRSFASGDPLTGVPGEGNMGSLQSGALEESNIDLTGELVNMIVAQRIYQANAQTIKTEDQVLQTLVNLR